MTDRESEPPRPFVSIVVATWNAARTFARCVQSIVEQDLTEWELLVSDGGSADGTVDLIRERARWIGWWRSGADSGIYDAWNRALEHARGDYVCFLGADDAFLDRTSLQRLRSAAGARPFDLITSRGVAFDAGTGKRVLSGGAWNYKRLGRRMVVCHPGLLHRRTLFDEHGKFDVRYKIAGDLDFLLRLPPDVRTLDVDTPTVLIETSGISRRNVLQRLREQRDILKRCERYGPWRANLAWIDKLWRYPIAKLFDIPH
jgi:glycosyltransferase involved in cell wall biosynthesis